MEKLTPMLQQYRRIKSEHPDVILFFRLGDFYEMFGEDAKVASKELELVLTSREAGKGKRIPMCGVPYHAVERYLARLIKKGYKVAICEQMEDPKLAKGLVKREIIRIVTPGTVIEDTVLDDKSNNYLVALSSHENTFGLAAVDISTGEFMVTQIQDGQDKLFEEIARLQPAECLLPPDLADDTQFITRLKSTCNAQIGSYEPDPLGYGSSYNLLISHFQTNSLRGFGCEDMPLAIEAAGAILKYLMETQKSALEHIKGLSTYNTSSFMVLDTTTRRNLELTGSIRDGSRYGTLLWVIDKTLTSMGGRLIKHWLGQPLMDLAAIQARLAAVEELVNNRLLREELRERLKSIHDLERLTSKLAMAAGSARDLLGLKDSLAILPQIKAQLGEAKSKKLQELNQNLGDFTEIVDLITNSIDEEPPAGLKEGGLIKAGYDEELDKLRRAALEGKDWIANLEQKERQRTHIKSLKVGYNQVFGYYIEVTKSNLRLVPKDYIRKQTMANAERFITPQLKEYEALVLGAEERIADLEYQLFCKIRDQVVKEAPEIISTAKIIAELDVLNSLAQVAVDNRYTKPVLNNGDTINIKGGRHAVVELTQTSEPFVPNDAFLDCKADQMLIITGPNMAGKSTYLRQIALIVVLAQLGGFVPADDAEIGVIDRIFTRVGAFDDLSMGQSTFMVEMTETANILNNATPKSLIILDEIGRGTSTFDGLSIAWAVAEYIHNPQKIGAKTLFATHYHHLNELEQILPGVKNYRIAVKEEGDNIIFLRKIIEGGTDRSYGIQVARLAGLPPDVLERAKEVLWTLEQNGRLTKGISPTPPRQLTLFETEPHPVLKELENIDISDMTPLQAINKLFEIQQKLKAENRGKGAKS